MRHIRPMLPVQALTFVAALLFARPALAGPLLICHPFPTGGAESLPWGTAPTWHSTDPGYDSRRLVADVVRLLDATPTVLARMETLRRATLYAARDAEVAAALLAALQARAERHRTRTTGAWAAFDAGYLVETYRQASQVYRWDMLTAAAKAAWAIREAPAIDGYASIVQALAQTPDPGMEFAASLVAPGTAADGHRRRAEAGARPGSPLAQVMRAIAEDR